MTENDSLVYYQHFINKFPGVTLHQAKELLGNDCIRVYKKDDVIYREGHAIKGCYFVHAGIVKIYNTGKEGKQQIIKFEKDGDLFGFRSLIRKEPACTSVEAMSDVVLLYISANALQHLLLSSAPFTYQLMQITCKELGDSNSYLKDMAQKNVKARLAEALCTLINDFGVDDDGVLNITLSREELADLIGTATETVIRLLSEFKTMGLIATKGRRLRIISRDEIGRIAL
ncbi:MAG: Crp/Fnr family transcriptional regulator [Marinifilaceae bacterium]